MWRVSRTHNICAWIHICMYLHYILMSPETSPTAPPRVLWLQLRKLWAPVNRSDWLRQVRVARDLGRVVGPLHETALTVRPVGRYFKFVNPFTGICVSSYIFWLVADLFRSMLLYCTFAIGRHLVQLVIYIRGILFGIYHVENVFCVCPLSIHIHIYPYQ